VPCSPIIHPPSQKLLVPFDRVCALWPNAQTVDYRGEKYAVFPHHPYSQIQLRAVELDVPPPILYYFGWGAADGTKPFEVQKQTAALATSYQRAYILNDMGTGKTRAALWSWYYLRQAGVAKKLLVVAPLSTLKFVWLREIGLIMPQIKAAVLYKTKKERLAALASDADIYIINHHGLKTIVLELQARTDIDTLILDELAVYRNNSQRSKCMRAFAQRFTWVWGMTGRPMPNSPVDVWNQCKILTPQTVPKNYTWAKTALMQQVDLYRWVPREGAIETAFSWMRPAVRYSLDDVVELPDAIARVLDVELSDEQAQTYRTVANEFIAWIKEQRITAANAAVALGKLLQISSGYVYTDAPAYVTLDSSPRQQLFLDLLEEAAEKVIVFCPWRHLVENLSVLLTENEIDHAVVHGEISLKKRGEIFFAFQETSQYKVLLAHPACLHHGVTLTAATTIIWYSPVTSLEQYEQANARIRRVGQKHKQLFLHLQSTAVERKVYAMLRTKARMQDAFLDMIKTATTTNGA
jgi:SNF2 family DNA or RNA helicase